MLSRSLLRLRGPSLLLRALAPAAATPASCAARQSSSASGSHPDFAPRVKAPAAAASPAAAPAAAADVARVKAVLAAHPVVLFMKGSPAQPQCGFSAQAVRLLAANGVAVHGEDVLKDAGLRVLMKDFSQWPTFPQLYVKGEFVGGCDIMTQMQKAGELEALLKDVPKVAAKQA